VTEQAPSAAAAPDGRVAPPPRKAAQALLPAAADGVELVARFFRALGDPARLRLLEFLLPAEHTVSECVQRIGLSQGRVSAHLACLADCGYVQVRRAGRFAWYKVADPRVADLVMLARSLAADNAAALAECVRIAPDPAAEPRAQPGPPPVMTTSSEPPQTSGVEGL
jgi:ArsR family transcriptional regulator, cadmium/lead-responsive transcriptional repressor